MFEAGPLTTEDTLAGTIGFKSYLKTVQRPVVEQNKVHKRRHKHEKEQPGVFEAVRQGRSLVVDSHDIILHRPDCGVNEYFVLINKANVKSAVVT